MPEFETIILSGDGPIRTITLNRPDKLNAIGGPMREEISSALRSIEQAKDSRVVILTGAGRGFCAGGDIDNLRKLREANDEAGFQRILAKGKGISRLIRSMSKPVIAAVNGPCAGAGFSLALSCDLRIASEKASFGPSFARIGLHPDWGGSWLLPRLIGTAKSCELVFTGAMVSASEAERIGLANRVVAHEALLTTATQVAGSMARNPPGVLSLAKRSIYQSLSSEFESAMELETSAQMECFRSEDFLEGVTAFIEKREPEFNGR
jgi:2-(1,2-epoxy-1,2-dihydrophenyl)acetyl-CoA isomerase